MMTQSRPTEIPHPEERRHRLADLAVAVALLALTLPLMILVAIAIKCESRGPVLCRRQRVAAGRRFLAIQFRTTVLEGQSVREDAWNWEGHTRIGWLLRLTRIDNLPQLINVLRGDMSCIDPRPERPLFLD
jgi:lipopolysaccharide/colanic/teichoic acid biosynthesis glycosyltransferase